MMSAAPAAKPAPGHDPWPARYAAVLRRLLAPGWRERRAADSLLLSLLVGLERDHQGRWRGPVAEALDLLGEERDAILAAVIAFWADASLQVARCSAEVVDEPDGSAEPGGWETPLSARYPLQDQIELEPMDVYGIGIATLLSGIGPAALACLDQLIACLRHPHATVPDAATDALGSMGPAARVALPALLEDVRQRGEWCTPFRPGIALARIIAGDTAIAEQIAQDIDPHGTQEQVAGPCAVLRDLDALTPAVVDALLQKTYLAKDAHNRAHLLAKGAQLAAAIHYNAAAFRRLALDLAAGPDGEMRAAAAWALGNVGSPAEDAPVLIALASDRRWSVRVEAHRGAACWSDPPRELVHAVASDLGNFEGFGGEPHYAALATLVAWKDHAAVALPTIAEWLERCAAQVEAGQATRVRDVAALAQAIGPSVVGVQVGLERLRDLCCGTSPASQPPEPEEDEGDDMLVWEFDQPQPQETELPSDLAAEFEAMRKDVSRIEQGSVEQRADLQRLMHDLQLPLDEEIPGTPQVGLEPALEALSDCECLQRLLDRLGA